MYRARMTTAAHLHARNYRKPHARYCKIFASELLQLQSTGPSAVGGGRGVERKTGKRDREEKREA